MKRLLLIANVFAVLFFVGNTKELATQRSSNYCPLFEDSTLTMEYPFHCNYWKSVEKNN